MVEGSIHWNLNPIYLFFWLTDFEVVWIISCKNSPPPHKKSMLFFFFFFFLLPILPKVRLFIFPTSEKQTFSPLSKVVFPHC